MDKICLICVIARFKDQYSLELGYEIIDMKKTLQETFQVHQQ